MQPSPIDSSACSPAVIFERRFEIGGSTPTGAKSFSRAIMKASPAYLKPASGGPGGCGQWFCLISEDYFCDQERPVLPRCVRVEIAEDDVDARSRPIEPVDPIRDYANPCIFSPVYD